MTPKEIQEAARAFALEHVRPGAEISLHVNMNGHQPLYAGIYPNGIVGNVALGVWASDWPELFDKMRREWGARGAEIRQKTIRRMALEIIRITAEFGECTDAALRGEDFSADEIKRYGAEAVKDADEMAGNGPFGITLMPQSNAA